MNNLTKSQNSIVDESPFQKCKLVRVRDPFHHGGESGGANLRQEPIDDVKYGDGAKLADVRGSHYLGNQVTTPKFSRDTTSVPI